MNSISPKLVQEMYEGAVYEYYPLGQYVVAAPGVCGGRPTFKYTRLEVSVILSLIAAGETVSQVVQAYGFSRLSPEAVAEAIHLYSLLPGPTSNNLLDLLSDYHFKATDKFT